MRSFGWNGAAALTVMASLAVSGAAGAQADGANAQGDVSITIYNNNLALIQDTRQLSLPSGRSKQDFPDVSAAIRPETVSIQAEGAGVVEQNFDYDLLSPDKLMDKAVGQTVTLVRTNPATGAETSEPAEVLANNNGTIVRVGNRIEILGGQRVVFPSLPPGLRARPTLSVTLDSSRAGRRPVTLSYLSRAFGWKADYVALFDEKAGKLDMQGWITLTNSSGTGFGNARVLLVAGKPAGSDDDDEDDDDGNGYRPARPSGNRAGTQSAAREQLGDYYVYPIAARTTVANAQQKQVGFLDTAGVPATKGYTFRNAWSGQSNDPQGVDTVLRFSTARAAGLGDALPQGTVRVYMRDAQGQPQFIGENTIPHTPMGSTLAIKTGEAFDVKVKPTLVRRERIQSDEWERSARYRVTVSGKPPTLVQVESSPTYWRTTMSYTLTNARAEPVTVELVQAGLDRSWSGWDVRVPSESQTGQQRSQDERVWMVAVPAGGEVTLTAQFDTRY